MIDRLFSEIYNLPREERNEAIKKMLDVFRENPEIFEVDTVSQGIISTLNKIEKTTENNPIAMATFFKTMEKNVVEQMAKSAEIFARMGEGRYYVISLKETYEFLKHLEKSSNELLKEAIEKMKRFDEKLDEGINEIAKRVDLQGSLNRATTHRENKETRACIRKVGEDIEKAVREEGRETRRKVEEEGRKTRSDINDLGLKIDTYYNEIRSLIESGKKSVEAYLTEILGKIGDLRNVSEKQVKEVNKIASQVSEIYGKFDEIENYLEELKNGNKNLENILSSLSGHIEELKRYVEQCNCPELKDLITKTYKRVEELWKAHYQSNLHEYVKRAVGDIQEGETPPEGDEEYLTGVQQTDPYEEKEENYPNLTAYNPMDIMKGKIEETEKYKRRW